MRTHMQKARVAIIGTGNIGSDLLVKVERSPYLTCTLFTGQNPASPGIAQAKRMGVSTSSDSINAIVHNPGICDIVFDATNAVSHKIHAPILRKLRKFVIDMTPSKIGVLCVPLINLKKSIRSHNVNMVSCGGQANIPLIAAIMLVHPETPYIEVVSSISSRSAGIGTRENIDEYTQTTSEAIMAITGVPKAKTIIILNPADPPILMHNTIYAKIDKPNMNAIVKEIRDTAKRLQKYVPGFRVIVEPVNTNDCVMIMTEVVGLGDFLPVYAGNLDIINCAAVAVAEEYAKMTGRSRR